MSRVSLNKSQYSQYGSRRVRKISTVRFEDLSLFGKARATTFTRLLRDSISSFLGDLICLEFRGTLVSFRFVPFYIVSRRNCFVCLSSLVRGRHVT